MRGVGAYPSVRCDMTALFTGGISQYGLQEVHSYK
jgi:hypothetical protein